MYAFIRGKLVEFTPHHVVIDVGGVGYLLLAPLSTLSHLPPIGHELLLYTSLIVREMSMNLCGFIAREERDLFEILLNIPGIGPKTALALIGHLGPGGLSHAIHSEDPKRLTTVPGIGKKTAERLIIELKGKVDSHPLPCDEVPSSSSKLREALSAMINLGYSPKTAENALNQVLKEHPEEELPSLIAKALQKTYK